MTNSRLPLLTTSVVVILLASPSFADTGPERLTTLRQNYEQAVEKARAPLRETYQKELRKLKTEFTEQGDLEAALAVEMELDERFPSGPKVPKFSALSPDPVLASVSVSGFPLVDLEEGVPLYGDADYVWVEIPDSYGDVRFAQPVSKHTATTKFRVESDGLVYVAFYSRWVDEIEENNDDILSRKDIRRLGWRELREEHNLTSNEATFDAWIVCVRECKAGEDFTLRTDKYCAPIVLSQ